jgi:hypothetical protein
VSPQHGWNKGAVAFDDVSCRKSAKEIFMNRLIATVSLYLASGLVLAANLDEAANVPAVEVVPTVYVVLFVVLFFGMIIGFFGWLWWNEKHRRDR